MSEGTPSTVARPTWFGGAAVLVVAALLWALRDLVVLVGLSLVLAFALDPAVNLIERFRIGRAHVSRGIASLVVVVAMVVVVAWLIVLGAPRLLTEVGRFLEALPGIAAGIAHDLRRYAEDHGLEAYVHPATEAIRTSTGDLAGALAQAAARSAGTIFGNLGQLLGLAILPVLSFYLLAEGGLVRDSAIRFVPSEHHDRLRSVATAIGRALRAYVRGQAIVCLVVGIATGLVLEALRVPYALLLGVLAGVAEVIPYLGFVFVLGAIALAGLTSGPVQILAGIVAYVVINSAVGFLVTPRVMGRYLQLHPFVVTVSVLAGAKLLGTAGVMVALPLAAVVQALVAELAPQAHTRPVIDNETAAPPS